MSPNAIVWWVILVAVLVVLGLAAAQALRAMRELNRIKARVAAYEELPVFKALAGVEANGRRLEAAVGELAPLIARARIALAVIRRGPLPPELIAGIRSLRAEIAAFRRFARR